MSTVMEKVKQFVFRDVTQEAVTLDVDTRTPEAIAASAEHQRIQDKNLANKSPYTLGDLEMQYTNIHDQLSEWERVREDATQKLQSAQEKLQAANNLLAFVGENPTDQRGKDGKLRAEVSIEKETRNLTLQEKRLKTAEANLKFWAKQKNDFPSDELIRLRKEQVILSSVPGTVRGGLTTDRLRGL